MEDSLAVIEQKLKVSFGLIFNAFGFFLCITLRYFYSLIESKMIDVLY